METKLLSNSENDLNIAAEIIRSGGTVVFPTETVYGLGADALNPDAVKKIFTAKGRPADNPLIVHIYDVKQLNEIVSEVPESAKKLMDKFWPGPLTIILKKSNNDKLEEEGFVTTIHGKGTYVTASDKQLALEARQREAEADFEKAIDRALAMGMSREDILETVTLLLEEK